MNGSNAQTWSDTAHYEMDAATEQDFGNLIDFDSLDLDFAIAGYSPSGQDSQQLVNLSDSIDGHHLQGHFNPQVPPDFNDSSATADQGSKVNHGIPLSSNGFFDYTVAQSSQAGAIPLAQAQEHLYRHHEGVPPTPTSMELHGDPHRYLQQMTAQQSYEQRFNLQKEDAAFTPLVSPAVTPHDVRFQIPDFIVPGAYFSPLTSPALDAQSQHYALQSSQNTTSESSTGQSPIHFEMENVNEPTVIPQEQTRRLRSTNKRNAPRSTNTNGRARQSPIVKSHRRKGTVSSLVPPNEVSELREEARLSQSFPSGLDVPRGRDRSETDSISPEPLSSEMPPPPKPGSLSVSPAIMAQQSSFGNTPATPASLMRIQSSPDFCGDHVALPMLEHLTLPEAFLDRPIMSRMSTSTSSCKTPKLYPSSTPGGTMSSNPSPMIEPTSLPTSPAVSVVNGKIELKSSRNPKKRNSVSSNLVSPALRPKISPSMKPLLPDGKNGTVDNTHALLLASKSNYQNILDGTTVPGVVYPTSLSTNLTSKRTSHKIAEQGRRNRINTALQEMQALLPSPIISATDAKSPESTAQQLSNSKAAKVESAIGYIKQLKYEIFEKDELLDEKDHEIERLKNELAAMKQGSVASAVDLEMKVEPAASFNVKNQT